MSHASAHTWLGVGFPSSPTGGMLGATAVIAQAGAKLGAAAAGQGVRIPSGAETCPAVLESLVSSLASGTAVHFLEGRTSAGISAGPLQRALVASAAWSTALGDVLPPSVSGAVTAARFVLLVAPPSAGDSDAVNGVVAATLTVGSRESCSCPVVACTALWRGVTACQDSAARRADAVRV